MIGIFIAITVFALVVYIFYKKANINIPNQHVYENFQKYFSSNFILNNSRNHIIPLCLITTVGIILAITGFWFFNKFRELEQLKDSLAFYTIIQRIILELLNRKFYLKEEDPEINIEDFSRMISLEFYNNEKYIQEKILQKIKNYIDVNETCIMQSNIFLDGNIHSYWKLKEI